MTTDPTTTPVVDDEPEHCAGNCGVQYDEWGEEIDDPSSGCVCCPCCCDCLGCIYGPRDGMLMFPEGAELP